MTTDRVPSLARRCRHHKVAPTSSFLSTPRGRRPFRGLPLRNPAGPPNTSAESTLRPSPAFFLLPLQTASPHFENCRRAILEPLKLSGPRARMPNDPERRRVTTDRVPSRARRCCHHSFAPTSSFLATARARSPFRGLPPRNLAVPTNTNTKKCAAPVARLPPSSTAHGLASL